MYYSINYIVKNNSAEIILSLECRMDVYLIHVYLYNLFGQYSQFDDTLYKSNDFSFIPYGGGFLYVDNFLNDGLDYFDIFRILLFTACKLSNYWRIAIFYSHVYM